MTVAVRAFHPDLGRLEDTAQGQRLTPVYWGGPDGNVPGSATCAVRILMTPGWVSMPHVHDEVQVTVALDSAWYGVLTLWGPNLENPTWLHPGGVLAIPPGVPHVALYPSRRPDNGDRIVIDAIATEFRNTPDYRYDVRRFPNMYPLARRAAARLGVEDLFDWEAAVAGA